VLERRRLDRTKVIILPQGRRGFFLLFLPAPVSCYYLFVWKRNSSTPSFQVICVNCVPLVGGLHPQRGLDARPSLLAGSLVAAVNIYGQREDHFIEAALAHLGERQTEVNFKSRITCEFWRYCVRSTEAASDFIILLLADVNMSLSVGMFSLFGAHVVVSTSFSIEIHTHTEKD
jgi:hypothetical protein